MKLEKRVIIAITAITVIGELAIIFEAMSISKYTKQLGISATPTYVSATVAFILMLGVAITCSRMLRKTLKMHITTLKSYTDKLAKGEVDFNVKAPSEDEFITIYEAIDDIVKVNKEDAMIADAIANGDLTVKCQAKSENDILGGALANLIKTNNEVLSGIHESSTQLTTGAEQVAAASQTLAQGSTEQAAAIEQVTVSMKEIKTMTAHNAEQANKATDIVMTTKNEAELGNERMISMKEAMGEINASSEKISKIIKVIDDISFQTNILALNAAVEAARAGTHGKGFAVVAEQIRELAGKSAQAAAETADMIDDSIRKVHNGTKLADETSEALSSMMKDIEQVVSITDSITKASNEQATAVGQIDQAISQVSQVVQNNSATSEECAAAAEELSSQSFSLRQMIGRYKLTGIKNGDSGSSAIGRSYTSASTYRTKDNYTSGKDIADPESIISLDGDFGKY